MNILKRVWTWLRNTFSQQQETSATSREPIIQSKMPQPEEWAERVWDIFSQKLDTNLPDALQQAIEQANRALRAAQERDAPDGRAGPDFVAYAQERIAQLHESRRHNTAATLQTALQSLRRFWGSTDSPLPMGELTPARLRAYQEWLLAEGVGLNTLSCYMRALRALYNQAVAEELVVDAHPFRPVYSKVRETSKRAIPAHYLQKLKALTLDRPGEENLALVRDLFLFSFYARGMSFVDMAYLRKDQITGGMLVYARHKTHQEIRIRMERCMQEIVDRYLSPHNAYVFPVLTTTPETSGFKQYRSRACYYNKLLKELGRRIGLQVPLTFYVARHTWASLAFHNRTDLGIISKALGHTSLKTTLIYIKSIESDDDLHAANRNLIRMVGK